MPRDIFGDDPHFIDPPSRPSGGRPGPRRQRPNPTLGPTSDGFLAPADLEQIADMAKEMVREAAERRKSRHVEAHNLLRDLDVYEQQVRAQARGIVRSANRELIATVREVWSQSGVTLNDLVKAAGMSKNNFNILEHKADRWDEEEREQ